GAAVGDRMVEGAPGSVGLLGAGEVPSELDAVPTAEFEVATARDACDLGTDSRAVCRIVFSNARQIPARWSRWVDVAFGSTALHCEFHYLLCAIAISIPSGGIVHSVGVRLC